MLRISSPALIISLWFLLLPLTANAQNGECAEFGTDIRLAGRLAVPDASGVAVSGDRAYVAAGDDGLLVVDIADPDDPVVVDTITYMFGVVGVWCSEERLLVLDANDGLRTYALPLPVEPPVADWVELFVDVNDVAMVGDKAYVAFTHQTSPLYGLTIFHLVDAQPPVSIDNVITTRPAVAVDVAGDHAYVLCRDEYDLCELVVVEVTDPYQANLVTTASLPHESTSLAVCGDHLVVPDEWSQYTIYDVSDPGDPQVSGYLPYLDYGYRVVMAADGYVYAASLPAESYSGIEIIGFNPYGAAIVSMLSVEIPEDAADVDGGKIVMVGGDFSEFAIVEFTPENAPVPVGLLATPAGLGRLAVRGDHLYTTMDADVFQVIDIDVPVLPSLAGSTPLPGNFGRVALGADHAYLSGGGGLVAAVDIRDPDAPDVVGTVTVPGGAAGIGVRGDHVFVAAGSEGLQVINASDPANLQVVAALPLAVDVRELGMTGHHVVVAAEHWDFYVVDVSDPLNPVQVGYGYVGYSALVTGLAVAGDTVYLADRGTHAIPAYGLQVWDLTDPTDPVLRGGGQGFPNPHLFATDDHLYGVDASFGLLASELVAGHSAHYLGSMQTPWTPRYVAAGFDQYLYVTTSGGLVVGWRQCGDTTAVEWSTPVTGKPVLSCRPNPFNPRTTIMFTLAEPDAVTLTVYDLGGRMVRRLLDGLVSAGRHEIDWNGRDAEGREVPSGVYLSRLETAGMAVQGRMLLVR